MVIPDFLLVVNLNCSGAPKYEGGGVEWVPVIVIPFFLPVVNLKCHSSSLVIPTKYKWVDLDASL